GQHFIRLLRVRGRMFAIFGQKAQPADQLTVTLKLPTSFEMVQDLWFVRESRGWYRQHQWAIAHFGANDDPLAELPTLQAWMRQSYCAVAPKRLGRLISLAAHPGESGEPG
ncbi:MAG: hypothetical protein ABW042_11120, partial [Phenylobacterium sp.]